MFKSYTAARLASSKPKRCKCCGVKKEKIQGYCSDCLKIDSPEMKAIVSQHANESKANSNLGKIFAFITICIIVAMIMFSL